MDLQIQSVLVHQNIAPIFMESGQGRVRTLKELALNLSFPFPINGVYTYISHCEQRTKSFTSINIPLIQYYKIKAISHTYKV